jgi:hypothetical protein
LRELDEPNSVQVPFDLVERVAASALSGFCACGFYCFPEKTAAVDTVDSIIRVTSVAR